MKKEFLRVRDLISRDKMMDLSTLPDLISAEVADRLSAFLKIDECISKIKVTENNKLDVLIAIRADVAKIL